MLSLSEEGSVEDTKRISGTPARYDISGAPLIVGVEFFCRAQLLLDRVVFLV